MLNLFRLCRNEKILFNIVAKNGTVSFICTVSSELLGFYFYFFPYFSFLSRALDEAGHLVSF